MVPDCASPDVIPTGIMLFVALFMTLREQFTEVRGDVFDLESSLAVLSISMLEPA